MEEWGTKEWDREEERVSKKRCNWVGHQWVWLMACVVGPYSTKLYKLVLGRLSKGRKVDCMGINPPTLSELYECQEGFCSFPSLDTDREPVMGAESYILWQEVRLRSCARRKPLRAQTGCACWERQNKRWGQGLKRIQVGFQSLWRV